VTHGEIDRHSNQPGLRIGFRSHLGAVLPEAEKGFLCDFSGDLAIEDDEIHRAENHAVSRREDAIEPIHSPSCWHALVLLRQNLKDTTQRSAGSFQSQRRFHSRPISAGSRGSMALTPQPYLLRLAGLFPSPAVNRPGGSFAYVSSLADCPLWKGRIRSAHQRSF
jgi:hypothetical protein